MRYKSFHQFYGETHLFFSGVVILRRLNDVVYYYISGVTAKNDTTQCQEDLFRCSEELAPGKWCIPRAWVCDGEKDCPGGADESATCRKYQRCIRNLVLLLAKCLAGFYVEIFTCITVKNKLLQKVKLVLKILLK
jgi:hypothetical protein